MGGAWEDFDDDMGLSETWNDFSNMWDTGDGGEGSADRAGAYWDTVAEIAAAQYEFWETNVKPEIIKALPGIFEEMAQEREAAKLEREEREKWINEVGQAERDGTLDRLYLEGLTLKQQEEWLKLEPAERENRLAEIAHLALERDEAVKWMALGDAQRAATLDELETMGLQQEEARAWLGMGEGQRTEIRDLQRMRAKYRPELEALADVPVEQLERQRAGEAGANVEQALAVQREGANRRLTRMGVDVSSAAYQGQTRADQVDAAALNVGARNQARSQARSESFANKSFLAGFGTGLPTAPQPVAPPPAISPVNFQPSPAIAPPNPTPASPTFKHGGRVGYAAGGGVYRGPPRIIEPLRRSADPSASNRVGETIHQPGVKAPGDTRKRLPFAHGGRVGEISGGVSHPSNPGPPMVLPRRQLSNSSGPMLQTNLDLPRSASEGFAGAGRGELEEAYRALAADNARLNALLQVGEAGGRGVAAYQGGGGAPDSPSSFGGKPREYYADGGEVHGPGTETSDSIPTSLEEGSYVINAKVLKEKGTDFFNALEEKYPPTPEEQVPGQTTPGRPTPGRPLMLNKGGSAAIARWSYGLPNQARAGTMSAAQGWGAIARQQQAEQQAEYDRLYAIGRGGVMFATVPGGTTSMAEGGEITGVHSGDAPVPVMVSDEEFVVSPPVVKAKGLEFFDKINFPDATSKTGEGGTMGLPKALPI